MGSSQTTQDPVRVSRRFLSFAFVDVGAVLLNVRLGFRVLNALTHWVKNQYMVEFEGGKVAHQLEEFLHYVKISEKGSKDLAQLLHKWVSSSVLSCAPAASDC